MQNQKESEYWKAHAVLLKDGKTRRTFIVYTNRQQVNQHLRFLESPYTKTHSLLKDAGSELTEAQAAKMLALLSLNTQLKGVIAQDIKTEDLREMHGKTNIKDAPHYSSGDFEHFLIWEEDL